MTNRSRRLDQALLDQAFPGGDDHLLGASGLPTEDRFEALVGDVDLWRNRIRVDEAARPVIFALRCRLSRWRSAIG
jgi:hypothetical protein